jgi:hypothetical protein
MNASGIYGTFIDRMELERVEPDFKDLHRDYYALSARCDMVTYLIFDVENLFYVLPNHLMSFYEQLMIAPNSPFYEKLQLIHDWMFESGIRQHWKFIMSLTKFVL